MEENEAASGEDAPPPEHQGESGKAGPAKEGDTAVPNHSFTPPDLFQMQELIPAYKFLEFVDRGGMGAVYRAHHPHLDRDIAVKLLPPNLREDPSFEKRFRREARTMAKLSHPNIVSVHDFGETKEGHLYIVMEYVEGSDLRRLIQKQELNAKDILPIITQVCDALQYAHDNKIVHRDIKPANILIDGNGVAKVADFGLAKPDDKDRELELSKVSVAGVGVGTPAYMAPEAIGESEIDHRADIFSFGVVIYEMITGTVPMGAWQPPSKTAGADMRFDDVVQRAMQAEPKDRYQQAGEIRHAFDEDSSNSDVGAQPAPQARSSVGKTIALVSVALTLLLLAATALSWNGERFALLDVISPPPPPMSVEEFEKINREMSEWVFTKGGVRPDPFPRRGYLFPLRSPERIIQSMADQPPKSAGVHRRRSPEVDRLLRPPALGNEFEFGIDFYHSCRPVGYSKTGRATARVEYRQHRRRVGRLDRRLVRGR